ncbi:hypothetical protein HDU93_005434 [Gonapodya sp. JEL0774]|nr:hypothetical protein HDU93_005434 [Gonapodya sp. JEL0774]
MPPPPLLNVGKNKPAKTSAPSAPIAAVVAQSKPAKSKKAPVGEPSESSETDEEPLPAPALLKEDKAAKKKGDALGSSVSTGTKMPTKTVKTKKVPPTPAPPPAPIHIDSNSDGSKDDEDNEDDEDDELEEVAPVPPVKSSNPTKGKDHAKVQAAPVEKPKEKKKKHKEGKATDDDASNPRDSKLTTATSTASNIAPIPSKVAKSVVPALAQHSHPAESETDLVIEELTAKLAQAQAKKLQELEEREQRKEQRRMKILKEIAVLLPLGAFTLIIKAAAGILTPPEKREFQKIAELVKVLPHDVAYLLEGRGARPDAEWEELAGMNIVALLKLSGLPDDFWLNTMSKSSHTADSTSSKGSSTKSGAETASKASKSGTEAASKAKSNASKSNAEENIKFSKPGPETTDKGLKTGIEISSKTSKSGSETANKASSSKVATEPTGRTAPKAAPQALVRGSTSTDAAEGKGKAKATEVEITAPKKRPGEPVQGDDDDDDFSRPIMATTKRRKVVENDEGKDIPVTNSKKRKAPKQEGEPNRPPPPFMAFRKECGIKDIKEASERWKVLSDEEKKEYEMEYKEKLDRYKEEKVQWDAEHPDTVVEKKARTEKLSKEKPEKASINFRGMPKRPTTAFFLFHKNKGGSAHAAGEIWKTLSSEERSVYEAQAKVEADRYKEEIMAWKKENPDVVVTRKRRATKLHDESNAEETDGEHKVTKTKRVKKVRNSVLSVSEAAPEGKTRNDLQAEWKTMTEADKKPWTDRHEALQKDFQKKKAEWAAKQSGTATAEAAEEDEDEGEEADEEGVEDEDEDSDTDDDDEVDTPQNANSSELIRGANTFNAFKTDSDSSGDEDEWNIDKSQSS